MSVNSIDSSEGTFTTETSLPELDGVYGEKLQAIRDKIDQGDFQGAKDQIQREFAEIDAKYKGCYLFLDLAKFKSGLAALNKELYQTVTEIVLDSVRYH